MSNKINKNDFTVFKHISVFNQERCQAYLPTSEHGLHLNAVNPSFISLHSIIYHKTTLKTLISINCNEVNDTGWQVIFLYLAT